MPFMWYCALFFDNKRTDKLLRLKSPLKKLKKN